MVRRLLIVGAVFVWSFLTIPAALALATSPVAQVAALGLGVAPVGLLISRLLTAHDSDRPALAGARAQEWELLRALEEQGTLTPTAAALRTSVTLDEASALHPASRHDRARDRHRLSQRLSERGPYRYDEPISLARGGHAR